MQQTSTKFLSHGQCGLNFQSEPGDMIREGGNYNRDGYIQRATNGKAGIVLRLLSHLLP